MSAYDDIAKFHPQLAEQFKAAGVLPPEAAIPCRRADGLIQFAGMKCYAEYGHKGRCYMVRVTTTGMEGTLGPVDVLEYITSPQCNIPSEAEVMAAENGVLK